MKRIHSLNYEYYALDYLEGTLSAEDQASFEAFLERHPEVAAEIEGLDEVQLTPPVVPYPNASKLYRREEKGYWGWAAAAGWLLLICCAALWWILPADSPSVPAVAHAARASEKSITVEQVPVSHSPRSQSIARHFRAAVQPLNLPAPLPIPNPLTPKPADKTENSQRVATAVASLPLPEPDFVEGGVVVVTTRPAYGIEVGEPSTHESQPGLLNPESFGVYEPISQILTEDQKNRVAQWRPIENLKDEVSRSRWADAITPEYFSSSKSTK